VEKKRKESKIEYVTTSGQLRKTIYLWKVGSECMLFCCDEVYEFAEVITAFY
jgi:hypothetical protein